MGDIDVLTGANLTTFFVVLAAFGGLFVLFANVVESFRKLRRPRYREENNLSEMQRNCAAKFTSDFNRLGDHERRLDSLEEGERVQLDALHALLEHAIHNGNSDEMKAASAAIFNYLNK